MILKKEQKKKNAFKLKLSSLLGAKGAMRDMTFLQAY